jgi:hypothetical protein
MSACAEEESSLAFLLVVAEVTSPIAPGVRASTASGDAITSTTDHKF